MFNTLDSITHIVLGAAIGDTILGKKIGRKAAWIGMLAKTLPDFDLFYTGLKDPRLYMCCHRGHTHSLIWETVFAFPIAWLFYWLFKRRVAYQQWLVLFLVCLLGHSLLDTCTNFGTRLFLPFTQHAYSWNTIAIADLFFTVPMLIMLVVALCYGNLHLGRRTWMNMLLGYCVLYIGFTLVNKSVANRIIQRSLDTQGIPYTRVMTNPSILNNILWYGVAATDSTISVGEFTLMKKDAPVRWLQYPRHTGLLDAHPDTADAKLLRWFSQGYSICQQDGDTLNVYCVKFGRTNMKETGLEETFIFHYKLFYANGQWQMGMEEPNEHNANMKEGFIDLVRRIQGKAE